MKTQETLALTTVEERLDGVQALFEHIYFEHPEDAEALDGTTIEIQEKTITREQGDELVEYAFRVTHDGAGNGVAGGTSVPKTERVLIEA